MLGRYIYSTSSTVERVTSGGFCQQNSHVSNLERQLSDLEQKILGENK
jgi:hypothetical protein